MPTVVPTIAFLLGVAPLAIVLIVAAAFQLVAWSDPDLGSD